ncbi:hypothetical protein, partial [Mesorhizobium silamurunense]|uniref:hypothetical protein n=1 Tax=Mesorhizobium silamurunense TaxID=499528 RepID=UPI0017830316
ASTAELPPARRATTLSRTAWEFSDINPPKLLDHNIVRFGENNQFRALQSELREYSAGKTSSAIVEI